MIARNILAGSGFTMAYDAAGAIPKNGAGTFLVPSAYMPPGYVGFLTVFLKIFGDGIGGYLAILLVQASLGAVSAVILYKLSSLMLSAPAARLAGFFAAFYPPLLYAASDFGTTVLYAFLLGILLFLALRISRTPSVFDASLAGIAGGLMSLVRGEGLLICGFLGVWLLMHAPPRCVLTMAATVLLVISPWFLRNFIVFHAAVPVTTSSGFNFWRGHNPIATGSARDESGAGIWGSDAVDRKLSQLTPSDGYEVERDRVFLDDALSFIGENSSAEFRLSLRKLFSLWVLDTTHPRALSLAYVFSWGPVLVLSLMGAYQCLRQHVDIGILLFFALGMTLTALLFFVIPRYQIILAYGLLPLAAAGAAGVPGFWVRGRFGVSLIITILTT